MEKPIYEHFVELSVPVKKTRISRLAVPEESAIKASYIPDWDLWAISKPMDQFESMFKDAMAVKKPKKWSRQS